MASKSEDVCSVEPARTIWRIMARLVRCFDRRLLTMTLAIL